MGTLGHVVHSSTATIQGSLRLNYWKEMLSVLTSKNSFKDIQILLVAQFRNDEVVW